MTTLSPLIVIKALGYFLIGLVAAVLVINTLRVPVNGATTDFKIQFADAEGLVAGNPVSMSGVRIGRVDSISLRPQSDGSVFAEVTVEVKKKHQLPQNVHAAIRYSDMLGARYIALTTGVDGNPLRHGNKILLGATSGPVNLTALMNGFEPLFSALNPEQVNTLARGFVDTFEGRTGSVKLLLQQIASLGQNLSNNSVVFARLVSNLTVLLNNVGRRSPQLTQLFSGLNQLTSTLLGDNGQLANLLDNGDKALSALSGMMTAAGDSFRNSLVTLTSTTQSWIPNTAAFENFLKTMPVLAQKINQSGRYGGFMMLYLCNFTLKVGGFEANIFGARHTKVCL